MSSLSLHENRLLNITEKLGDLSVKDWFFARKSMRIQSLPEPSPSIPCQLPIEVRGTQCEEELCQGRKEKEGQIPLLSPLLIPCMFGTVHSYNLRLNLDIFSFGLFVWDLRCSTILLGPGELHRSNQVDATQPTQVQEVLGQP